MRTALLTRIAAASMVATLGLTGVASAQAGHRSFQRTYPYASRLCTRAANGRLPKRLQPQSAQVTAACATLQSGFAPLQSAVLTAETQFKSAVASVRASVKSACATKGPACRAARIQGRAQIRNLRAQRRLAARTYYVGIEANRRTFWSTIRSLRGGRSLKQDRPIPVQSS